MTGLLESRILVEALPFGLAVYDEDRRLVLVNAALPETLRVPPDAFRVGATLADHALILAHRGLYGPGDPAQQAAEIAAIVVDAPRRTRRRHPDGRTLEAHYAPLPGDAMLVCVLDTSALVALREEAERAVARIQGALAGLRIGLAVFAPDRRLELNNLAFADLLGLSPSGLRPGMSFHDLLQAMQDRQDYTGLEGDLFLAEQVTLDRNRPSSFRRERANGQVVDVQSDPLPDGGWSLTVSNVSTIVHAEDEARRRTRMLEDVLDQMPHGVTVFDRDRRVTMVNHAYPRIMPGPPLAVGDLYDDIIRRRAAAGEYGESDPAKQIEFLLAQDRSVPQMRRRRLIDGRTIDIRTAPLPGGGYVNVVADVSTLVDAQDEAAREAELMAGIVSHIPHGVSVYGPDRRLRLVNTAYHRIMAGAPIEIGDTVEDIIQKRALAGEYGPGRVDDVVESERAHDGRTSQIRRRRRPNGAIIDIRAAPLPDGGHISVVTDVSSLATAETELARRTAEMDAMLANIRHGIVLWDGRGCIVAANEVVTDLLNAEPGLFVPGRSLEDAVQSALDRGNLGEGQAAQARARWLLEQDRSRPQQDQRLTRNGRVLEVRSDPIPGGGFVTTYTDVTHASEAEDALRLAKSAAEAATAAKSSFLAAMSTELRSPLHAILEDLSAIARDAKDGPGRSIDPARVLQSCDAASDAARRLLALVDTILDVARLEAGRFDLSEDRVDIPSLVRHCLRRYDSAAAAAEVALVVDLPDMLPPVRGDERRLRQALGNLVGNAVKFAGAGGSVSISARPEWTSGDLLLRVQDTGAGIAAADLDRVFEPFTQAVPGRAGSERPEGAGLGLYVSRTLLRAHGGDITLRSVAGQGVTAEMRLPATRVLHEDASTYGIPT